MTSNTQENIMCINKFSIRKWFTKHFDRTIINGHWNLRRIFQDYGKDKRYHQILLTWSLSIRASQKFAPSSARRRTVSNKRETVQSVTRRKLEKHNATEIDMEFNLYCRYERKYRCDPNDPECANFASKLRLLLIGAISTQPCYVSTLCVDIALSISFCKFAQIQRMRWRMHQICAKNCKKLRLRKKK